MDLFHKINFSKEKNSIFGLKKTFYILPFSTSCKHKFISAVHCFLHKSLLKNLGLYISGKTAAEQHVFVAHFPESKILPNQLCTLICCSTPLSSVSVLCKEQEVFTKLFLLVSIFSSYLCGPQKQWKYRLHFYSTFHNFLRNTVQLCFLIHKNVCNMAQALWLPLFKQLTRTYSSFFWMQKYLFLPNFLCEMWHWCFHWVIYPAFSDHFHMFICIYLPQILILGFIMSGFIHVGKKIKFYCFWRLRSGFLVICCDLPSIGIQKCCENGSTNGLLNQMDWWLINLKL